MPSVTGNYSKSMKAEIPKGSRITCIHAAIAKNGVIFSKSFAPVGGKSSRYIPDSEPRLCETVADAAKYFQDCITGTFKEEKKEK